MAVVAEAMFIAPDAHNSEHNIWQQVLAESSNKIKPLQAKTLLIVGEVKSQMVLFIFILRQAKLTYSLQERGLQASRLSSHDCVA